MNHCHPWSNSRGDTHSSRKHAHGSRMNAHRTSQNTGMPRPGNSQACLPAGAKRRPGRGARGDTGGAGSPPVRGGIPGGSSPGGNCRQRTMLESNQVLMVPSCGPQVYGLIVCVFTDDSDGSAGSGVTPVSTG